MSKPNHTIVNVESMAKVVAPQNAARRRGQLGDAHRRAAAMKNWLRRLRKLLDAQKLGLSLVAILILFGMDGDGSAKAKATVVEALLKRAWERGRGGERGGSSGQNQGWIEVQNQGLCIEGTPRLLRLIYRDDERVINNPSHFNFTIASHSSNAFFQGST